MKKKPISIRMIHVLAVIIIAGATLVDSEHCPPADKIVPCVCHGDTDIKYVICKEIITVDYLRFRLGGHHFKDPIPKLVITGLQSPMLPSDVLGDIKVVELEILASNNIPRIDPDAFRGQPLVSLRLDRIGLEDVPKDALINVRKQLKVISMSGNVLKKLGSQSLLFVYAVENLTLTGNKISEVAIDCFPGSMQYLWISDNLLTTFSGSLHPTPLLKYLDASNNILTSIKGEFKGLYGLKTLILDKNLISDISDSFSELYWLKELSIAGNWIPEIGEAFADLEHLTHLNLEHSTISNLSRTAFDNLTDLYDLNLSENFLTALQICPTLIPLRSLRRLKIQSSLLENLSLDCLDSNTNLEHVDLSRNKLSTLWFTNPRNLVTLDISFNNFRFLSNLGLPMYGSATLILENNQWLCSKDTTSLLKDLEERGYKFPHGYPSCLPSSEKAQTCMKREHSYPREMELDEELEELEELEEK